MTVKCCCSQESSESSTITWKRGTSHRGHFDKLKQSKLPALEWNASLNMPVKPAMMWKSQSSGILLYQQNTLQKCIQFILKVIQSRDPNSYFVTKRWWLQSYWMILPYSIRFPLILPHCTIITEGVASPRQWISFTFWPLWLNSVASSMMHNSNAFPVLLLHISTAFYISTAISCLPCLAHKFVFNKQTFIHKPETICEKATLRVQGDGKESTHCPCPSRAGMGVVTFFLSIVCKAWWLNYWPRCREIFSPLNCNKAHWVTLGWPVTIF